MRQKLPIIILQMIIVFSAIAGALVCIFAVPAFGTAIAELSPEYAFYQYPTLVGLYAAALCFFFALYHFWILLNGVNRNQVFPAQNLKMIRISATTFSVLYFIFAMPVVFLAADAEDAPGLVLIGAFLDMFPIGIAAFAAVLERAGKYLENKQT